MEKLLKTIVILSACYASLSDVFGAVPSRNSSTDVMEKIIGSYGSLEQMLYNPINEKVLPLEWGGRIPSQMGALERELMALELRRIQYPETRIINTLSVNLRPPVGEALIISDKELDKAKLNCKKEGRVTETCLLRHTLWPKVSWMLRSYDQFELQKGRIWKSLRTLILGKNRYYRLWNQNKVNLLTKRLDS